jgi:hypothetical protein
MEEMSARNMPVQRPKVAILPQNLSCSGPVTHSGEILTTVKSHGKKPDRFTQGYETLFPNWQKESWQTFEETSGYVRPEGVNKWPNSMTDKLVLITKLMHN